MAAEAGESGLPGRAVPRRLKARGQFLRVARGKRAGRPGFGLQAAHNETGDVGVGFTVTRKAGNSPERNRIRRRLRAAVTVCADDFVSGRDYVLVGRREALSEDFAALVGSLRSAIRRLEAPSTSNGPGGGARSRT